MNRIVCNFCSIEEESSFLLGVCDSCGRSYDSCFDCATKKYGGVNKSSLICKSCIRDKKIIDIVKNQ